jgi:DNA-binding NtrC family response regulator
MNKRDFDILNGFNILYIEDEIELLRHTKTVLEDFAKNIFAVQTCKEALDILKNHHIDVIISDILLENENGIECLKYIKDELHLHIPAILTTAYTDIELLLEAIKLKVENYIVKPISIKELLNSLHDVLLPKIQQKEINRSYNIIKTISVVTDGKQVELVRFIINNLDEENILNYSYSEIMEKTGVSKPTIVKLFRQLSDQEILVKIQNGKYQFNETKLPIPQQE